MQYNISEQDKEKFNEEGILVLRNFYLENDILDIQKGIYDVIGEVLKRHGLKDVRRSFEKSRFDDYYNELIKINRSYGAEVYDLIKHIPAFVRLVANPVHEKVMRILRNDSIPALASGGYGIRIDNPFEDKYRTMWHQEYPSQLRSIDGVVFWTPLVSMTNELGPVNVCLESHRGGALSVYNDTEGSVGRTGTYALRLMNEAEIVSQYKTVAPITSPTDLIVMDYLLVHSSGYNRSSRSRWSMQFRYFNLADPVGRSYGWKGSYAAGIDFSTVHPELLINMT